MGELAAELVLDRSALRHNMKPLERDGFVEVVKDATDGRTRRVKLTPLGEQRLEQSVELWNQAEQSFERALGKEKSDKLRELLEEVVNARYHPQDMRR